jgi:hypothetical protein
MKFPFGNKIPFVTVVEDKGKKITDVIVGIPGDTEWSFYKDHPEPGFIFLKGQKHGARTIFILINKMVLSSSQKTNLGIYN